jgi:hypothetical protein
VTLLLGYTSYHLVAQVTDRLVSRAGVEFDPVSNKTIVYEAQNGLVIMSYTGLAYLENITTDTFIAEKLSGFPLSQQEIVPTMITGMRAECLYVGPMLEQLRGHLADAFATRVRPIDLASGFTLFVNGWQWGRRKHPRPIAAYLTKAPGSAHVELRYVQTRHLGRGFLFSGAPQVNVDPSDTDFAMSELALARDVDDVERTLVATIGRVSGRIPGYVGADCLSVAIPPPAMRRLRVRFIPAIDRRMAVAGPTGQHWAAFPAAFSPFLIGRGGTHCPSIFAGRGTFTKGLGRTLAVLQTPTIPAGSPLMAINSGQRRPSAPR